VRDLRQRVLEFIRFDRHSSYAALLDPCREYPRGKFYTRLADLDGAGEFQFEELLIRLAAEGFAADSQLRDYAAFTLRIGCARLFWCIHGLSPLPEWGYRNFASWLGRRVSSGERSTIVSFNWDLVSEVALAEAGISWSYSFSMPSQVTILKPHGSINWNGYLRERRTNESGLWHPIGGGSRLSYMETRPLVNPDQQVANPDLVYALFPGDPDLPSRDEDLHLIWQDVGAALRESDRVVFIGYSLPGYDSLASHFFEQNTQGKHVEVWNPCAADQEKYRNLFGSRITHAGGPFSSSPYARG